MSTKARSSRSSVPRSRKSTTIKMLTGILHPSSGEANVLGYVRGATASGFRSGLVLSSARSRSSGYHLPPSDTFNLLASIYEWIGPPMRRGASSSSIPSR